MTAIYWTNLALDTYTDLLAFLMQVSEKQALETDLRVEKTLDRLSRHRLMCPPSPKMPQYRRCVVNKHTSLIYEAIDDDIFIIAVVDNRQKPAFF